MCRAAARPAKPDVSRKRKVMGKPKLRSAQVQARTNDPMETRILAFLSTFVEGERERILGCMIAIDLSLAHTTFSRMK